MFAVFDNNSVFVFIVCAFFVCLGVKKFMNFGGGKATHSFLHTWLKRR